MFNNRLSFTTLSGLKLGESQWNLSPTDSTYKCQYRMGSSHKVSTKMLDTATITCGTSSLVNGTWFKLICGASSQDVPSIQRLCEIYTAAGVDCIDIAADLAIVHAAKLGIEAGLRRKTEKTSPLLMVSVNDDVDPHFRKAWFDPTRCPVDCKRPCEAVCPADAINGEGVVSDKCYGCGRCLPVCPYEFVLAKDFVHSPAHIRKVVASDVDAIEIHTGPNRLFRFHSIWEELSDVVKELKVVAISFPQLGTDEEMGDHLVAMWNIIRNDIEPQFGRGMQLIWQTDGRPMSGDITRGTARHSVKLAKKVSQLLIDRNIPGHVQLAGGTNDATVGLMKDVGLLRVDARNQLSASGIAVGGYARKVSYRDRFEELIYCRSHNDCNTSNQIFFVVPHISFELYNGIHSWSKTILMTTRSQTGKW